MNISLIMTAVQHGAIVANHTEVTAIYKSPDASRGGQDRICGARLKDNMTGEEWDVKCRVSIFSGVVQVLQSQLKDSSSSIGHHQRHRSLL